jgi:sulfate permease, SulP family
MKHVSTLDATGAANLDSLVTDFNNIGGITIISEANDDVLEMLQISGLYDKIGQRTSLNVQKMQSIMDCS